MDVPGMEENDIDIYRQNVVTIVKGVRRRPFKD